MPENISCRFTFVKGGVFYFTRRVPRELQDRATSTRIAYSLRTRSVIGPSGALIDVVHRDAIRPPRPCPGSAGIEFAYEDTVGDNLDEQHARLSVRAKRRLVD